MTRKIYKLVIFGDLGNEERYFECGGFAEAVKIKDMLLNGRPHFSLTEETTVTR